MTRSLRYRLLISATLCSVIVLGLLGISVYAAMRHFLLNEFDDSLREDARLLSTMVELNDGRIDFQFHPSQLPDYVAGDRIRYFQVWRNDGSILERSRSLRDKHLPRIAPTTAEAASVIDLPNDRQGRAISIKYIRRGRDERRIAERTVTIVAAAEPIDVDHILWLLNWMLTVLCLAAILIMGIVLLHVVKSGVRPVQVLAGQIESMSETDLTRRLPRDGVPTELTPMVDKMNGFLARLEGAFAREKSFTADVAHELRTPLTGLRMTLEVCRSRAREPAAYEAALDECRGITDRMEAMVESLLLLARSDAGQVSIARQEVDLCHLVSQSWSLLQYRADGRNAGIAFEMPPSLAIQTDAEKLGIVLRNVMDNAVSYVDSGGRIRINVRSEEGKAIVEIANTGSLIAAEDAPRLFERFWRGDAARTETEMHCGLGLSLCQRLMTLLGGAIAVETTKGGEFVVRLMIQNPSPPPSVPGPSDASNPSAEQA